MNIWREKRNIDHKSDEKLYELVDGFFENLHGSKLFEYRVGQHTLALDVLEALISDGILLMEAGVGSGKTWGYLIPLLYASKYKKNFKGFLISTSSIALQEQLKQEITKLSNMLGIDIPITIAKGRNNFICKQRLENYVNHHGEDETLKEVVIKVDMGYIDKEDFPNVFSSIFKNININHVNCSKCLYNNNCAYILKRKQWPKAQYVICNHDLLVESLKRDDTNLILQYPSILIVDEAHNLEDKIRNSYKDTISKNKIETLIQKINFLISNDDFESYDSDPIIESLNKIFRMISTKAKYKYRKNAKEYIEHFDEETTGFDISLLLKEEIERFIEKLVLLIKEADCYNYKSPYRKLEKYISVLKDYVNLFMDLISKNSKNIYWVSFLTNTKEHVNIEYVRKDIISESLKLLGNTKCPIVFTSATMTTGNDDYTYFAQSLGLDRINGVPLVKEYSVESSFDYQNNALLYLCDDCISPKSLDHDLYLSTLTTKIEELIDITKGRSLVLFTSKKDMKRVYEMISRTEHNFNIMLQTDDVSSDILKRRFKEDETSVLFATGSFFEGIDIKGSSLENVIITKLPFPVVNPIIEEKASHYKDGFKEIYLPEMIIKLKQGAGRLIRTSTDKGIVSILDPRYKEYEEIILSSLPFTNVTTNIEDVKAFTNNKLGISKVYHN